jgi:hypothetical protein
MGEAGMGMNIVCMKWGTKYSAGHVNMLRAMLGRHLLLPHQLVCITDDPSGIEAGVRTIPIWPFLEELPGCWRRLYLFSESMGDLLGERFASIDLDCVICGDVSHIFSRTEPFIINSYQGHADKIISQRYNGSLFLMDAGARTKVWSDFTRNVPALIKNAPGLVGTDQAWIRVILGADEAIFGMKDGIYEARSIKDQLPKDARLVFFSGPRDPVLSKDAWVSEHYH